MSYRLPVYPTENRLPLRRPNAPALTLLFSLLGFILASPFVGRSTSAQTLFYLLYTAMLLVGSYAVGTRSRAFWVAAVLGLGGIATLWTGRLLSQQGVMSVGLLVYVAFGFVVIGALLGRVLAADRVDFTVLCTAVSIYLLLGVVWAISYVAIQDLSPGSFSQAQMPIGRGTAQFIYFSLVTLPALGYGDITPVGDFARIWAALEAITGVLFIATLVARLVSLYRQYESVEHGSSGPSTSSTDSG